MQIIHHYLFNVSNFDVCSNLCELEQAFVARNVENGMENEKNSAHNSFKCKIYRRYDRRTSFRWVKRKQIYRTQTENSANLRFGCEPNRIVDVNYAIWCGACARRGYVLRTLYCATHGIVRKILAHTRLSISYCLEFIARPTAIKKNQTRNTRQPTK